MGLLRGRSDEGQTRRFQMREKLLSIGDDYWIEDEAGNRAYRVDGKAARLRETILLKDASGREVAKIQERKDRKSTRLNSSHSSPSRMPSSA